MEGNEALLWSGRRSEHLVYGHSFNLFYHLSRHRHREWTCEPSEAEEALFGRLGLTYVLLCVKYTLHV